MSEIRNQYIGVLVAMPEEARLLRSMLTNWSSGLLVGRPSALAYWENIPIVVAVTGQGEEMARLACRAMYEQYHPRLMLSTGYCGGLQLGVHVGDIVTSARIWREKDIMQAKADGDTSFNSAPSWRPADVVWQVAQQVNREYKNMQVNQLRRPSAMSQCWEDNSVTSNRLLSRSDDKFALGKLSGAVSVDMESAAVAEFASVARVPWLTVRVVSDAVSTDIPLDFERFTDDKGNLQYGGIVKEVLHRPSLIPGLVRFGLDSQKAGNQLRVYLQCLFTALHEYAMARN